MPSFKLPGGSAVRFTRPPSAPTLIMASARLGNARAKRARTRDQPTIVLRMTSSSYVADTTGAMDGEPSPPLRAWQTYLAGVRLSSYASHSSRSPRGGNRRRRLRVQGARAERLLPGARAEHAEARRADWRGTT